MPSYLLLRLFCFLTAILLPAVFSSVQNINYSVLLPLTLTHYILAIQYSRRQLGMVCSTPLSIVKFGSLIAAAGVLFLIKPPKGLSFVFGFHHVFSEVYLLHESVLSNVRQEATKLRVASIAFNLFAYFIATGGGVRSYPIAGQVLLWSGLAASGIANLAFLYRLKSRLTKRQVIETLAFEVFPLCFIAVSMLTAPIAVEMIVYYHVLFWVFYPCLKMLSLKQSRAIFVYAGLNVLLLTGFFVLVIGVVPGLKLSEGQKTFLFVLGSYFHILTTLSLSNAQPAFLTRFFNPKLLASSQRPAMPATGKTVEVALFR